MAPVAGSAAGRGDVSAVVRPTVNRSIATVQRRGGLTRGNRWHKFSLYTDDFGEL